MKQDDLDKRFDEPKALDAYKVSMHTLIRSVIKEAAGIIDHECVAGREKSLALTHLEDAMHWALEAVDRNPSPFEAAQAYGARNDSTAGSIEPQ